MRHYMPFESKEWWVITILYAAVIFTEVVLYTQIHYPNWLHYVSIVVIVLIYWAFALTIPVKAWNNRKFEQYKQQQVSRNEN